MTNKPSFDSLLKRVGNTAVYKTAQAMSDDMQFEQDFSKIAFSFVQDKAPGLMKYLLGFEIVERSDDGSRAVGIFGFKVGNDYYYVPAFFLNNSVKGVDMILNKRTNSFIPLTEEWVNEITNRQAVELGSGASDDVQQDFEDPDFDFLQHPSSGPLGYHNVKASEANEPWSFSEAWDKIVDKTKYAAAHDKEFNEAWAGFVRSASGAGTRTKQASADSVKDYISKIGGPKAVASIMQSLENIKFAEAAMSFYDAPSAFYTDKFASDCYLIRKQAEDAPKFDVRVTDTPRGTEDDRDIVENGFTITDKRKDSEKSVAYSTEYTKYMANPEKPGVYEVLMPGGEFKKGYVLAEDSIVSADCSPSCDTECVPASPSRSTRRTVKVYFPDDDRCATSYDGMNGVFVKSTSDNGGPKKAYDEASSIGDVEKGDRILLVGPDDTFIGPVDVGEFVGAKDSRPAFQCGINCGNMWSVDTIEVADFNGRPKRSSGSLIVPSDWKCLKLYRRREKREGETWHDYDINTKSEDVYLGSSSTMFDTLLKNAHHILSVGHSDGEFRLSLDRNSASEPLSFKEACIALVTRAGLGYDQAKRMLKSSEARGRNEYIVKFAQSPFVGVSMQQPQMPDSYTDPYTGMPTYQMPYVDETQGQLTGVPGNDPYENVYGENVGGEMSQNQEMPIDQEAQALAEQAAQIGQKNVFDQATIGGLSRVYDTGTVIDSYIPQFMESLDRLGRILFLYYWKHDDFISRYGTDDVVEMEDVLRSTFKTLGKLTLDLKRKTVGSDDADSVSL